MFSKLLLCYEKLDDEDKKIFNKNINKNKNLKFLFDEDLRFIKKIFT